MAKTTYTVLREHDGDRLYYPGEERKAEAAEVAHLVDLGVLEPKAKAAKDASKSPRNKAAPRAPRNKKG